MPRTTHRTHRLGALLVPLALVLITACSAGPSERPAVAYRGSEQQVPPAAAAPKPAPVPPLGPPPRGSLNWRECTEQTRLDIGVPTLPEGMTFSCSRLLTDLSPPGSPGSGTARISLLGVGSGSVPLVVVNDIRGVPGTTFAARLALKLPPEMLATFRIIGVDRRGSGRSDPAECIPPAEREAIVGFDPQATDRTAVDRLLDSVRSASQECLLELEQRAQAYDTWRTAADLEELRIELGVPHLHAIGRGEGSRVLTTYAQRYPASVGRMALDGAPDPTLDAIGRAKKQARAAEKTFDAFADQCGTDGSCPLGPDPRKTVEDLIERTRAAPLPGADSPVTAGELVRAILLGLAAPERWGELVRALEAADRGDGTGIARMVSPLVHGDATHPPGLDSRIITRCNDTTLRVPPQRGTDIAAEWVDRFPLFGGTFAQRLIQCSLWPVPQRSLPTPDSPTLPPIPVVATATDPLTPALSSTRMADQLAAGITVNWQGTGHGALGRSRCVTTNISRFLVHGTLPAENTACPA
ncbi:alpha/beta fold hydrolase [Haloactinomyces albus]|uniref:Pimeloyl-ACP methyl ester carboxylesterase n=1 Tax=Haloactinomyces albus TaxID=1352928 RepID=A0AAE4CMT1_9ACTN|nr:alpha/beta fold hydrolase [Haloactinomyces albus]MDR7303189.1 pimeloyl-ACP methyl ester carboxylesterase [Haloactinomyces albus]